MTMEGGVAPLCCCAAPLCHRAHTPPKALPKAAACVLVLCQGVEVILLLRRCAMGRFSRGGLQPCTTLCHRSPDTLFSPPIPIVISSPLRTERAKGSSRVHMSISKSPSPLRSTMPHPRPLLHSPHPHPPPPQAVLAAPLPHPPPRPPHCRRRDTIHVQCSPTPPHLFRAPSSRLLRYLYPTSAHTLFILRHGWADKVANLVLMILLPWGPFGFEDHYYRATEDPVTPFT